MTATVTFKLTEEQWSESLRLPSLPVKERDAWWRTLGTGLGFDPKTVDWVRPHVFRAVSTAAPVPPRRKTPSERSSGRLPASERPADGSPSEPLPRAEPVPVTTVSTEGRNLVMLDQVGCARCGADAHHGITYKRLTRPVELAGETLTHWAWCPSTGEPILLLIVDTPGDRRVPADLDRLLGGPDPLEDEDVKTKPRGKK